MDKSFLVFAAVGIGFLYFVTNFIGDIQEEDDTYRNSDYNMAHMYDQYNTVDSIGQDILDLTGADAKIQLDAWNKSHLKDEFLELFPNFSEMKNFINDRIKGKVIHTKLMEKLNTTEDKFFSGTIGAEEAKRELSILN